MKFTRGIKFIVVVLSIVLVASCARITKHKVDEGIMKYEITYLEDKANNPLISLLPSCLDMYFKDNSVLLNVEGWMGIFQSAFIKQASTGDFITMLKIMNKKYYYKSDSVEGFMGDTKYLNLKITFDDEIKEILTYKCQHAVVYVPANGVTFDVYYTTDIYVDSPNKNTVFEEIPGVLMEFQVEMKGIPMHLKAIELTEGKVNDEVFCIPEGYKEVDKQEVDTIFTSIM